MSEKDPLVTRLREAIVTNIDIEDRLSAKLEEMTWLRQELLDGLRSICLHERIVDLGTRNGPRENLSTKARICLDCGEMEGLNASDPYRRLTREPIKTLPPEAHEERCRYINQLHGEGRFNLFDPVKNN